ncbi:Hypothetical protein SMAX5B_018913 [Scophthalmus maximus]|uniref:Uncharacterized protein n=1 Tax=Scophthalmus maximus TaxID=52904 RepID=A0A2U9B683_SCOMX|nr:Hypothetical protein SMAX5B_018913 [Scophthalmus maximus]
MLTSSPPQVSLKSRLYTPTMADFQKTTAQTQSSEKSMCSGSSTGDHRESPQNSLSLWNTEEEKDGGMVHRAKATEVKVLDDEWKTRRLNVSHMLEVLAASFNQAESGCRQCECFDEETAEEFLKVLLSTLQNANSL